MQVQSFLFAISFQIFCPIKFFFNYKTDQKTKMKFYYSTIILATNPPPGAILMCNLLSGATLNTSFL